MKKRHATRGQALTETAIALPLFLMGLFGVIWAIREGAMSERVQLSVRYGGVLGAMQNPYQDYSLYAVYATIDGMPPVLPSNCTGGQPNIITNTRKGFFQPAAAPNPQCTGGVIGINGPETYSIPVMLQDNAAFIGSSNNTGGFLAGVLGGSTTGNGAVQNFFKSPDLESLTQCTEVGIAVQASLEGYGDMTSATTPPSPMPATVTVHAPIIVSPGPLPCVSFTAPPFLPTPTPSPTPSPT
ncbi:MAG TPA: hypothetical protein VKG44_02830, partial [Candidatus Baltobacteraceae bacterium]|nr:hypothetical protein [Candidatus Baltobacteraceae bacterium]